MQKKYTLSSIAGSETGRDLKVVAYRKKSVRYGNAYLSRYALTAQCVMYIVLHSTNAQLFIDGGRTLNRDMLCFAYDSFLYEFPSFNGIRLINHVNKREKGGKKREETPVHKVIMVTVLYHHCHSCKWPRSRSANA